jgi:hypothetical protein
MSRAVPGMYLYWPMDNMGTAHATDYSGNGRHGTVSGAVVGENPPPCQPGDGDRDASSGCRAGAAHQRLRLGRRATLATSPWYSWFDHAPCRCGMDCIAGPGSRLFSGGQVDS